MVVQAEAEVKMRRRKEGKREKYPENFWRFSKFTFAIWRFLAADKKTL